MSGYGWENGPPRRRRAANVFIVLAVLLPLTVAGWLVWHAVQGAGGGTDGDDKAAGAAPTLLPGPGGQADDGQRGDAHGSDGQKDSGRQDGGQADGGHEDSRQRENGKKELPLRGRTVVIDPGHNPHNSEHPEEIARRVDIGTVKKECDTAGASTDSGYAEAEFTLDLAHRVQKSLEKQGATVKLTHDGDAPYGPCVDERARTGNKSHADAAVSLHADGAPADNRGFHVIVPASVREGKADTSSITGPSRRLGRELIGAFRQSTGEPPAGYLGDGKGLDTRGDLGGLNLSSVPKVFLECGNMRNAQDADRLTDPQWRTRAADGVADGVAGFLAAKS